MDKTKLKSCPFCGGKAVMERGFISSWSRGYICCWVRCDRCEVGTNTYETEAEAINVWNRRVNDDERN